MQSKNLVMIISQDPHHHISVWKAMFPEEMGLDYNVYMYIKTFPKSEIWESFDLDQPLIFCNQDK